MSTYLKKILFLYLLMNRKHQIKFKYFKYLFIEKKMIFFSFHWFMAVICFPYLSGPVHFEDGTPVEISNDKPGKH